MSLLRIIAMLSAIGLVAIDHFGGGGMIARLASTAIDFEYREPLLQGMLAWFLFAAALQVRIDGSAWFRTRLVLLPLLTTVSSMLIVAVLANWVLGRIGVDLPMAYCLLLGALAAPADPLAINRLMQLAAATPRQAGQAVSESVWSSLFAVLLFMAIYTGITIEGVMTNEGVPQIARQAGIGVVAGIAAGVLMIALFRQFTQPVVVLALSLALLFGFSAMAVTGWLLAPVAAVMAGLSLALCRSRWAVTDAVRDTLERHWARIAEGMLALLLLWVGVEMALVSPTLMVLTSALFLVPLVIFARLAGMHLGVMVSGLAQEYTPEVIRLMVWGGVRSAVAVVLVLMLPLSEASGLLLLVTFLLLAFAILVQGPIYALTAGIARPLEKERAQIESERAQALELAREKEREKQSANDG